MWKPLVVLAIVANIALITPAEAHNKCKKPNEIYDRCPNPCPPKECGVNIALILCAPAPKPGSKDCKPGCVCKDGFVKNKTGICIPEKDCPENQCTKPNETFKECLNPCPLQRCDVDPRVIRCAAPPEPGDPDCEPGCECFDGYARDASGTCIPRDQCPQEQCRARNETFMECLNPCPLHRCDVDPNLIDCAAPPEPGDPDCEAGCECFDGYARDASGTCIPRDQCPQEQCRARNETFMECLNPCPLHRCDVDPNLIDCAAPPEPGDPDCEAGCECFDGYARDASGTCIPRDQCPPTCGENEVYSTCTNGDCAPKTCSELGYPIPCPRIDPEYCIGGCLCKEGYARDENGTCIPKDECPSCGGDPNAVSGCGGNCGRMCSNYNSSEPVFCPDICNINGCDCKEGFVEDDNTGKCIPPNECDNPPTCGKNEVLSNCSNGGCGPWRCTDVGIPTGCVKMDQKYCTVGCVCQEGYVRDENELCIPVTDCPECGGDPNAVAGCGVNCGRLCSNYKNAANISCITICYENACDCRKGFVKDENRDICVKPEDCTPTCSENEVFSECVNGGCEAKNCSQLGEPVPCVRPAECKPGCLCAEGYLRDASGKCIPKEQCPPKCTGANEIYDSCPPSCPPQTCESIGQKYFCPLMPTNESSCQGACRCKPNYFRNKLGECISEANCLKCNGPYEYYSCGGACDNVCKTLSKQNQTNCPIINIKCNEMCYCEKGYARDEKNICIPIEDCPGKCCENERWDECPARLPSPQSCEDLGFNKPVCEYNESSPCPGPPGCVCEFNYVRDKHGKCIPKENCPSCGGDPNAQSGCGLNCGRLCSNYDKGPVPCPRICLPNACDCKKDFVFDENTGKCVYPKQCTPVCKEHEVFSNCTNGGCDARNCSQLGQPVPCIKLDPKSCIKGCVCEEGYLRARNGTCVPVDKCDNCNKKHEHYDACAPSCPPQTCESIGRQYKCPPTAAVCRGACRCDKGYFRNKIGECVSKRACLKCRGPHEYPSCGSSCDNTCTNVTLKTNCPIKNIKCVDRCYCEDGYVRDCNDICIPIEKCPAPTCKENEVYDSCANGGCGKWNCSQLGQPDLCIDVIECIGGCNCKDGYLRTDDGICVPINQCPAPPCGENEHFEFCPDSVSEPQTCSELGFPVTSPPSGEPACICDSGFVRNDEGICIPVEECPSCGGDPHAESGCGINCGRLCSNYDKGPVACIKICKVNACDCKKGYVLDENTNKCVRPKKCTPTCGKDEVFSECTNGGCEAKNCSQLGKPVPCVKIDPKYCIKGCTCKPGYLREKNGICVPKEQCKPKCGKNEVLDLCPSSCPPQTCESINKTYHCPLMKIDQDDCKPACICKEGYFRNKNGKCISEADCLKCPGPNEFFDCGGACDNVCATLQEQNQTNCPIINIQCNPMCYCEKGYARNDKNICIPIDQCPLPICGKNERLETCPDWLCFPQNCSQVGYPIACPAFQGDTTNPTCPGSPGCVCIDNYARDDSGKCIPVDQCPSCGGDPNAVQGCGVNCGRLCSNYKKKNVICPLFCRLNGCDCREGYVFDSNLGKCVLPKDCTPTCGLNEVYDTCANGGCQKRNCSQVGEPMLCIDPIECIGGCVCQEGFLRNKNGSCVAEKECPLQCTNPHEVYNACPRTCPPQYCYAIGIAYPCPHPPPEGEDFCHPACVCEDGYYRNSKDICISEAQCLQCNKGNEHFDCGPECDNVCAKLSTWNQTNCPIKNKRCVEKCYCDDGYARDDNEICIPIDQCNVSCKGDPNAVPGCGIHCGNRCSDYNKGVQACPLICMVDGCDCKQGYVYDDNSGKCVLPEDCSKLTCNRPNEVYHPCPSTCPPQTCESLDRDYDCPSERPCQPSCICEDGYYRNKIGECITEEECLQCVGQYEYYSCAGACDNVCLTLNEQSKDNCPIDNVKCNEMCYCEDGYARNESNVCIPIKDCPPSRCGIDERWAENPCEFCEPLTCSEVGTEKQCPPVANEDCDDTPTCICNFDLVRNENGDCIPISECSK